MKPFRFKLKTVLEVRANEETQAGEVYAQAQVHLEEALSHQQAVEEAIEGNLTACQQAFAAKRPSGHWLIYKPPCENYAGSSANWSPWWPSVRPKPMPKAGTSYGPARREALEKFDEQQAAHDRELARTEQQAIDEMVLLREAGGFAQKC